MQPPPIPGKDDDHLRALVFCHSVIAGLCVLGLGLIAFHFAVMHMAFTSPEITKAESITRLEGQPSFGSQHYFNLFQWIDLAVGACLLVVIIFTMMSGRFIERRVNRTFSIVVAGCLCALAPFGTLLGIFTILILNRDSIIRLYEESKQPVARTCNFELGT